MLPVRYVSTRGRAPALGFSDVLLAGLARDGGLYVPETWPVLSVGEIRALKGLPYAEVAFRVTRPLIAGAIPDATYKTILENAYATFNHPAVTPLVQLDHRAFALEVFHGPTFAFKDIALQLLGRLFDHVLAERGERATIIGATSGDTGSAAIAAFRDREALDIVILHPEGRTSEIQRRQMTTVLSSNVHNIAIQGTFDDCQDLVKAAFNDTPFRDRLRLSAVNSINWARVMAQIVYYFHAAVALGAPEREIVFAVPTGNFGNVFAAHGARAMGLPIKSLIVGSNSNDILTRFFESGTMEAKGVVSTISPSMDIQISSNFERLLFDLLDHDGAAVEDSMRRFRSEGRFAVTPEQLARARALFSAARVDEDETRATIASVFKESGYILDPHTAVGVAAARKVAIDPTDTVVVVGTAHPAKFPDAVAAAIGRPPVTPPKLEEVKTLPERLTVLPPDLAAVEAFVSAHARAVTA